MVTTRACGVRVSFHPVTWEALSAARRPGTTSFPGGRVRPVARVVQSLRQGRTVTRKNHWFHPKGAAGTNRYTTYHRRPELSEAVNLEHRSTVSLDLLSTARRLRRATAGAAAVALVLAGCAQGVVSTRGPGGQVDRDRDVPVSRGDGRSPRPTAGDQRPSPPGAKPPAPPSPRPPAAERAPHPPDPPST